MYQNNQNEFGAELGVIGSILIDAECYQDCIGKITENDFEITFYKECFRIATDLYESGQPVDALLLCERLSTKYENARQKLAEIINYTPTAANINVYINEVINNSKKRKITQIGNDILYSNNASKTWQELSSIVSQSLNDIAEDSSSCAVVSGDDWQKDFMQEELNIVENPDNAYVRTRYTDIDNILGGGMVRGGLYVIGARPGVGKTTMSLNIAEQVARRGIKVLFISLEMSSRQIMCKRVSSECGIPYTKLMSGRLSTTEQQAMRDCVMEISQRPFYVNQKVGLNVLDIMSLCKQIKDINLLIIDYIGLIRPIKSTENRYNDYTQISGDLKQMAMMLNIPIIALSQLNRENTKRNDKKPTLADLRDTGAIEQDADAVIFLHRENYCNNNDNQDQSIDLIVAKNRHGNVGTVKMSWDGNTGGIYSMDHTDDDVPPQSKYDNNYRTEVTDDDLPF